MLVPGVGVEPTRCIAPKDFKSADGDSTTFRGVPWRPSCNNLRVLPSQIVHRGSHESTGLATWVATRNQHSLIPPFDPAPCYGDSCLNCKTAISDFLKSPTQKNHLALHTGIVPSKMQAMILKLA